MGIGTVIPIPVRNCDQLGLWIKIGRGHYERLRLYKSVAVDRTRLKPRSATKSQKNFEKWFVFANLCEENKLRLLYQKERPTYFSRSALSSSSLSSYRGSD